MADLPTIIRTETRGPMGVGRFYTRGVILGSIGKDDWSILVATIFSLVDSIAICFEVKYGLGRHSENVSAAESAENLKVSVLFKSLVKEPASTLYGLVMEFNDANFQTYTVALGCVCIISIYRMFTLRAGVISTDPSWDNISVAIWSCLELNVAIIASSLPTLRPLIARILPGAGLSSARNYRNTYHRYGSASAAMAHTGFQSTESRSQKMRSTSTEELALDDFRTESPAASVPNGIHSHVSSDTSKSFYLQDNPEEHRIVKTTEISVDVRER
ncbi:hypothetical protein HYQ45_003289 [Verticillium longisporum]|uniref:Rhodopsin domain-containing protein n=1 Tax=Verticillium longisporum TaxID=100787 RepID=A0A8I2ZX12_VERLO|nr:hypothetical protein HYQ45_003289 [Verticillium longisporum]